MSLLFTILSYSSKISLMSLTLVRNFSAALVWTHLWACIMFFIARESAFDEENSWLGGSVDDLNGFERYVTSLWWSVVTFTTVGMCVCVYVYLSLYNSECFTRPLSISHISQAMAILAQ